MEALATIFGLYTSREVLLACLCALAVVCWCIEARTIEKLREDHIDRMQQLQNKHAQAVGILLERERAIGWNEGREYQIGITKPKRDSQGRYAREEVVR